jgi:hypothetical protein
MRVYVETANGCCLRTGESIEAVVQEVLSEIGSLSEIKCAREATEKEIAWVVEMGSPAAIRIRA